MFQRIGVVGLGYVGLTLAAVLARKGYEVYGADAAPAVVDALRNGRTHIFEPGLETAFSGLVDRRVFFGSDLPRDLDAVVICVSTPVDERTRRADLTNLAAAAAQVSQCCAPGTLVVVRSTVPVGTSRGVVLPALAARWGSEVRLAMAPERTIQGQALRELVELPQVVGAWDEPSRVAAEEFFRGFVSQVVSVSNLETAELVKLSNNCHTDLIYAFGNELALISERHGLDPLEVVRAANVDYPRPDLCRPGYVGGGCLSKDPYLMAQSAGERGPFLVGAARRLNEYLPGHVADTVVELLRRERGDSVGARLAVLGWAYKGWPPTDDMRGTPIATMMPVFRAAGVEVVGHDPLVSDDLIRRYGGDPVDVPAAFATSDAVLIINDHPDYRALRLDGLLGGGRLRIVFDSWRILDQRIVEAAGVRYAGLGYTPEPATGRERPLSAVPA